MTPLRRCATSSCLSVKCIAAFVWRRAFCVGVRSCPNEDYSPQLLLFLTFFLHAWMDFVAVEHRIRGERTLESCQSRRRVRNILFPFIPTTTWHRCNSCVNSFRKANCRQPIAYTTVSYLSVDGGGDAVTTAAYYSMENYRVEHIKSLQNMPHVSLLAQMLCWIINKFAYTHTHTGTRSQPTHTMSEDNEKTLRQPKYNRSRRVCTYETEILWPVAIVKKSGSQQ